MKPDIGPGATRVLLAVVNGCRTYGPIIERTGLARVTVAKHLGRLKSLGLVTWDAGKRGTLRPLVTECLPSHDERVYDGGFNNVVGPRGSSELPGGRDQHLDWRR